MTLKRLTMAAVATGLILAVVVAVLALGSTSAQESPPKPKRVALEEVEENKRFFDEDNDKVFDNLEHRIDNQGPGKAHDVVVLFQKPVEEVNLNELRNVIGGSGDLLDYSDITVGSGNLKVNARFPKINGIATKLNRGQIKRLAKQGVVLQIENDDPVEAHLENATYWFGVQRVRQDFPDITGAGTSGSPLAIAILDTGIDPSHQDLRTDLNGGKIVGWADFTGVFGGVVCPNDFPCDPHGHGTHVASIAAGGVANADGQFQGEFIGVAPGANLVGVRVLDAAASGTRTSLNLGLEWVLDNRVTHNIQVLNLSLGFGGCSSGQSSTERLINLLVAAGVVVTVSAGNSGPNLCTIGDPGAAEHAITVAAMANLEHGASVNFGCGNTPEGGFYLACFSGRGPTFDGRFKPDISGPGVQVRAAERGTTAGYVAKSGTSMSSPFVAGVASLLRHAGLAAPSGTCNVTGFSQACLINNPVKDALMSTAECWGGLTCPNVDYGAGRLDAYAAVRLAQNGTGENLRTPEHSPLILGSLTGTGDVQSHLISVQTLFFPIAVTMIMADNPVCSGFNCDRDFDILLTDPLGNLVASSLSLRRQETIGILPTVKGNYVLRVDSFRGSGDYVLEVSAGTTALPAPQFALTSDARMDFGVVFLGQTSDTVGDPEVVKMRLGPGDLLIRTSVFSDGVNTWTLGTTSGPDQVVWEFSTDGTNWKVFTEGGLAFDLATGLRDAEERTFFFRLSMPTTSSSRAVHTATIVVTGIAPD